jgi:hypothetical protein
LHQYRPYALDAVIQITLVASSEYRRRHAGKLKNCGGAGLKSESYADHGIDWGSLFGRRRQHNTVVFRAGIGMPDRQGDDAVSAFRSHSDCKQYASDFACIEKIEHFGFVLPILQL